MKEMPLTVRRSIELIGLFVLVLVIVNGSGVITPLLLAFFLSIVFLPLHRRMMNKRVPELLSISICILILFVMLGLIAWFFSAQVGKLINDFPQLEKNRSEERRVGTECRTHWEPGSSKKREDAGRVQSHWK